MKYKSYRFVDGKAKWIIVDDNGNIVNKNPNRDELKGLEKEILLPYSRGNIKICLYSSTNTCYICGISFDKVTGNPYREYNKEENWTGRRLCKVCYDKDYNKIRNNDPNSTWNLLKSIGNRRTGNQGPNSTNAKGDNFEELTNMWRSTISTITVENLNKKYDNYKYPIDHSRDSELGIPQTRGKWYDNYNRFWAFSHLEREWGKEFDVLILYCASKDGNVIERIYIIPFKKEIKNKRKSIGIMKILVNQEAHIGMNNIELKMKKLLKKLTKYGKK